MVELDIEIDVGCDYWHGAAADLLSVEGLIPEGFVWPARTKCVHWEQGDMRCSLRRVRPAQGAKWADADNWGLYRVSPLSTETFGRLALLAARTVHGATWRGTPAGARYAVHAMRLISDKEFQDWKRNLLSKVEAART